MVDMYYTKSECWDYEGEWRLVLALRDCVARIPQSPPAPDVCLFDFPRDLITAILVGCRASKALIESIKGLVRETPELETASLRRVRLDEAEFVLKVNDKLVG